MFSSESKLFLIPRPKSKGSETFVMSPSPAIILSMFQTKPIPVALVPSASCPLQELLFNLVWSHQKVTL